MVMESIPRFGQCWVMFKDFLRPLQEFSGSLGLMVFWVGFSFCKASSQKHDVNSLDAEMLPVAVPPGNGSHQRCQIPIDPPDFPTKPKKVDHRARKLAAVQMWHAATRSATQTSQMTGADTQLWM